MRVQLADMDPETLRISSTSVKNHNVARAASTVPDLVSTVEPHRIAIALKIPTAEVEVWMPVHSRRFTKKSGILWMQQPLDSSLQVGIYRCHPFDCYKIIPGLEQLAGVLTLFVFLRISPFHSGGILQ
jgi:hypothetical protein